MIVINLNTRHLASLTAHSTILIGADEFYSMARQLMSQVAAETHEKRAENLMSRGFLCSIAKWLCVLANRRLSSLHSKLIYKAIFAMLKNLNTETQDLHLPNEIDDEPTRTLDCPIYPEEDMEDMEAAIEQPGHLNLGTGYSSRNLWDSEVRAAMFRWRRVL
ncbi:hypothetical protein F4778DRAFT_788116 [Xylariomycetidae sp. FL2044]|nr:hypothetical protein F4778DRAFT_788116 [Xylariomycetidae sp. FL2044]